MARGKQVILKVANTIITPAGSMSKLGLSEGCFFVKIRGVPEGVSTAQVILLFSHTVKKHIDKLQKYEFDFTELCPIGMPQLR